MLNLIDEELYFNISDAIIKKDFKVVFHTSQKIYENGWDFSDFLEGLIEHFRNILSTVLTNSTNSIETADIYKARYVDYKGKFSESDILRILNFLNKSQQELRFSQNQKLKIELILSHLIALESTKTISELISEVNSDNPELTKSAESSTAYYKPPETVKKKVDKSSTIKKNNKPAKTKSSSYITSPSQQPNFSFDDVVGKWGNFIHSINSEKGLTLGPALKGFNLLSLKDNNLFLSTEKNEDLNTFRLNEKYIAKKSEEFFGRRFNFIVNNQLNSIPEKNKVDDAQESKQTKSTDLYEEIIINELGGEKIA